MSDLPDQANTEVTGTSRLEAFSDGVFGIAMTLLVLEIRLPSTTDIEKAGTLGPALLNLWPVYLAYTTSFVTIAIMWANHHAMFKMIRRTDRSLLLLNALLLMVITFLNFPTVLVAVYLQKPDAQIAAMFYNGTEFVIGVLFNLAWWYAASRPHLLDPTLDAARKRSLTFQYAIGSSLYLVAFGLAFVNALASIGMSLALAIFFALPIIRSRSPVD